MTDIGNMPAEPKSAPKDDRPSRRFGWMRSTAVAAILLTGVALGAGGLAVAATATAHFGWQPGEHLARIQRFVLGALDSVGATSEQEAKIHDIIAGTFDQLAPDPSERQESRRQALALLRAPIIDRAAVEKLRSDWLAKFDAKSKKFVGALLDAANVLTPEQRVKLADRIEARAGRGPMGGFWRARPWAPGGDRHGPPNDGPGHGPGPGDGPDGGPDGD